MSLSRPRLIPIALTALAVLAGACGSESPIVDPSEDSGDASGTTLVRPSNPEGNHTSSAGHGSTTIALAPGASLDVCDLVPRDEAERIIGRELAPPRALNVGAPLGQTVCTFAAADRSLATVLQVSVVAQSAIPAPLVQQGYTIQQLFAETRALYPASTVVTGIGDEAFRHADTLEVLYNGYAIGVSLSLGSSYANQAASLETLAAIASLALSQLSES